MKTREDQASTFICVLCAAVVREGLSLFFCVPLFLLLKSLNVLLLPVSTN